MKLLICKLCQDVIKMDTQHKTCKCGMSKCFVNPDGITAFYSGEGVPLGFSNSTLREAIINQPFNGLGETFTSFVIPKSCKTCTLVDNGTYLFKARLLMSNC